MTAEEDTERYRLKFLSEIDELSQAKQEWTIALRLLERREQIRAPTEFGGDAGHRDR